MKMVPLFLVLIILTAGCTAVDKRCSEGDDGRDYYVRGSYSPYCPPDATCGAWIDVCLDEETLVEYSCDTPDGGDEIYVCPKGCEHGACVDVDFNLCEEDSDCIRVQNGCCECVEGETGRATSINKEYEQRWSERISKDCGVVICSGDAHDPSCFKEPRCIENKCTLVSVEE